MIFNFYPRKTAVFFLQKLSERIFERLRFVINAVKRKRHIKNPLFLGLYGLLFPVFVNKLKTREEINVLRFAEIQRLNFNS